MESSTDSRHLWEYVQDNDLDGLRKCIESGADLNQADDVYHQTAVSWAAELGYFKLFELLVQKGADVRTTDDQGMSPLHWAARRGMDEAVKMLLNKGDVNQKTKDGQTSLHQAVLSGNSATISTLVQWMKKDREGGLDPTDCDGRTPLYYAIEERTSSEIINYLLKEGSDANGVESQARPLIVATCQGNKDILQTLLDNHADPKLSDENGRPPLYWAAKTGQLELAKRLEEPIEEPLESWDPVTTLLLKVCKGHTITSGLQVADDDGWTALHLAANIDYSGAIIALLKAGSDVNAKDREGQSALILAAKNGRVSSINALIGAGKGKIDLEIKDIEYQRTALCWAAGERREDVVQVLINAGSVVNSLDGSGRTPLILAAMSGSLESIESLLKSSEVKLDITDDTYEQSAVSYATEYGRKEIVRLLIKAGCQIYSQGGQLYPPLERAAWNNDFDLLRLFFEEKSHEPSPENLPRAKAIEEALYHAYHDTYDWTINSILAEKKYLKAADKDGRTLLSLAAESGHNLVTEALLDNFHVEPDKADKTKRTPLSWAAASGREAVVKQLLSIGPRIRDASRESYLFKAKQPSFDVVNVDSKDDQGLTPLWHAALGGYMGVIQELIKHGADPRIKNLRNEDVMQSLTSDERNAEKTFRNETIKMLEAYFSLLTDSPPKHDQANEMFSAMSLQFLQGIDAGLKLDRVPLMELLSGKSTILNRALDVQWLHLPANNMRWVEVLMTRYYEAYGDKSHRRRNLILNTKLWEENEQIPLDRELHHGRFMRPACHMLPLVNGKQEGSLAAPPAKPRREPMISGPENKIDTEKRAKAEYKDGSTESCHTGLVLYMPYLHWELEKEVENQKNILKGKLAVDKEDETKIFLQAYLNERHPLHIRRTLDQYYYPRSSKIDDRDKDQTVRRYYKEHHLEGTGTEPVLTMVDQLWMWVLPRYEQSPPTIITAFPQRSNRSKTQSDRPKWVSSLVASIIAKCGDLSSRSCYEVAEVIVAECSRFYLDSTSNRKEILQFREVYRNSIATIMDRDAARFERFEKNLTKLNQVQEQKNSEEEISEGLKELSDIAKDTEDLRQIKDIRDELNIMISLFHIQGEVTEEMRRIIEEEGTRHGPGIRRTLSPYSPQETVKRNIEQLKGLDDLAERAAYAIDQLLELKQKQADLLLTKAIYKINNATDKQGKTVMTFTVVTIVFLPASFMASFLALEVSQFPWVGDRLPLNWVLKILLSVSVPLTVTALAIAFSLSSQRIKNALLDMIKHLLEYLVTTKAYGLLASVLSERNAREKRTLPR